MKINSTYLWIATFAAIGVAVVAAKVLLPQQTPAGQVFDAPGQYRAPHGQSLATLTIDAAGRLTVKVQSHRPWNSRLPFSAAQPANGAESTLMPGPWFAAWDDDDRLWLYAARQGVNVWNIKENANQTTRVGEQGGWDGIPTEFFNRLPDDVQAARPRELRW